MPNLNTVILIGNLTRDVELRYTPSGVAIGMFTLAINRKWKNDQGEEKQDVTFVDCKVWRGAAETVSQYVKKGDPLCITGRLTQEIWDDKQTGSKRSKLLVTVEGFQFLGTGGKDAPKGDGKTAAEKARSNARAAAGADAAPEEDDSSEVPF